VVGADEAEACRVAAGPLEGEVGAGAGRCDGLDGPGLDSGVATAVLGCTYTFPTPGLSGAVTAEAPLPSGQGHLDEALAAVRVVAAEAGLRGAGDGLGVGGVGADP
jgi:hypothetical protein